MKDNTERTDSSRSTDLTDTGPVTADVKEQIMQEKDPERLRIWLKAAARAESVEQFTADNLRAGGSAGAE